MHEHPHRDAHHDELGHGLRPNHTIEAEDAIQQQEQRNIEDELAHQRDGERVLRLPHSLEAHPAHRGRADEGQDPHERAQHFGTGRHHLG